MYLNENISDSCDKNVYTCFYSKKSGGQVADQTIQLSLHSLPFVGSNHAGGMLLCFSPQVFSASKEILPALRQQNLTGSTICARRNPDQPTTLKRLQVARKCRLICREADHQVGKGRSTAIEQDSKQTELRRFQVAASQRLIVIAAHGSCGAAKPQAYAVAGLERYLNISGF